jgi:beta-lactamase class A
MSLEREFSRLEKWCDGILGVSAVHLPSGNIVKYNADHSFLLCSTYKIPMAVCLLNKIANKELSFDKICTITKNDLRPSMTSTLNQLQYETPVPMSILNLMQLMLQESCNTSTDILLNIMGGPKAVMACLENFGIHDLRVDRSTYELIRDSETDREAFKKDIRDKGTPAAMTELLVKIKSNEVVEQKQADLLLKIMQRCKTGAERILGRLPPKIRVSHKTGTATGFTHDVGIITIEGQGDIVLSIFVECAEKESVGERVVAEVARTIYDYFLFKEV